ncbi:PAS domain-containing sensor histidine kinase [Xanthovirga aplysinae]|uniref:PAS domain-containing sensor histidine kinase n=1 Tax=Xanthovirga aplysinae TaxID=2529853 RepID=UPI0012BCCB4F|nr:PAS domain-containing sensor histidine kinase [Xanthovirga aplysinae]MTI32852.1 PAS domain-containing sensor histidine kinase [Xanthovirga aplysinae]
MVKFKILYENSPCAILILEKEQITDCNKAAVRLFEVKDKASLLNITPPFFMAPTKQPNGITTIDLWKEKLTQFQKEGEQHFAFYSKTLKGKEFWAELHFVFLHEEATIPTYAIYWKDISELREAEKNFNRFVESSPDVIYRVDRNFNFLFVNDRSEESTGKKGSYFIGKSIYNVGFPKKVVAVWDKTLKKVFKTGKETRVEFLFSKDIWYDRYMIPEKDEHGDVNYVIGFSRDISKRKKAEKELLLKQKQLQFALEFAQLAYWETDLPEGISFIDPPILKMYGLKNVRKPIKVALEDFFEQHIVPEDVDRVKKVWKELAEGRLKKASVEYCVLRDGEKKYLISGGVLIKDEEGRNRKIYGITQDITELKKREVELKMYRDKLEDLVEERTKELKESQEYFKVAIQMANLWRWEYDPSSGDYIADEYGVKLVGLKNIKRRLKDGRVVFIQNEWLKFVHPDDLKLFGVDKRFQQTHVGELPTELIFRLIDKEGRTHYCYTNRISAMDPLTGKLIKRYGVTQDITRIREAEAEKERLYRIVESTSDIIAIVDTDKTLVYLNKAGLDFFGITTDTNLSVWQFPYKKGEPSFEFLKEESINEALQNIIWNGENVLINKYGEWVPVSQVVIAHFTAEGNLECFSTTIRDMTARKRVEEELRFKNNELDTFLYKTYHDLRGPVASLKGINRLARKEVHEIKALHYFRMNNNEVDKLDEIVQSLINLSEIKEKELIKKPINFSLLIDTCLDNLRKVPGFNKISFRLEISPEKSFICDESLLKIIFINVIKNAIQYRNPNVDSYINIVVSRRADQLMIKVFDNGQGIPSELKEKVFDMFFRANVSSHGPGLGLYLVKNAVDALGGRIRLQSEKDHGTTILIFLPFVHQKDTI